MTPDSPFASGQPRPIATVLDALRARIDAERFDAVGVSLEAVAADLGYGDVRPLPGAVAWIRELRGAGKKIALAGSGERARSAVELAGVADLFDAVVTGSRNTPPPAPPAPSPTRSPSPRSSPATRSSSTLPPPASRPAARPP